jgi:tRNA(Leu) C34 or U34 (ribose-2'-O)-methylase TrmL
MAVASLSKLTVPLPPGQTSPVQGLLMPKLQYRFRVVLENFGIPGNATEITKQVMNVTRPEVSFEQMELHVYNSRIKYAGKHAWSDVTLTVRDDVSNSVTKVVGQQIQKQFDFFEQASAASGVDYKFTTRIEILDGGNGNYTPQVLETFVLEGCYLQKAVYQQGDYSKSDPMDIAITISYDNAIQLDVGTGDTPMVVGNNLGRTLGQATG